MAMPHGKQPPLTHPLKIWLLMSS